MTAIIPARAWAEPLMSWRASFDPVDHEGILTTMAESIFVRSDGTKVAYKPALSAAILAWESFAHDDVAPLCRSRIVIENWRIYFVSKMDLAKVRLVHGDHIRCVECIDDFMNASR